MVTSEDVADRVSLWRAALRYNGRMKEAAGAQMLIGSDRQVAYVQPGEAESARRLESLW